MLGSNNPYPSVLLKETAQGAISTPASGHQRLFLDASDGFLKLKTAAGAFNYVESQWARISKKIASGSSSLAFTSGITSAFDQYRFDLFNVFPATDNVSLLMEVSHDGGSTWDTASNSYFYASHNFGNNLASGVQNDGTTGSTATALALNVDSNSGSNAGLLGVTGSFTLFRPADATQHQISADVMYFNNSSVFVRNMIAGWVTATTAITAVRFRFSSGNVSTGHIKMSASKA